ncbi:hypothetical protein [Steroidobacter gossypii]|nr:hypothetical protein [Steroidobacter gossypii]
MSMPFWHLQAILRRSDGCPIGTQVRVEVHRGRFVTEVIDAAATVQR